MGLKLKMTIDNAKHVDTGIWRATLEPDEAATLGKCESRSGPFSVLLIESAVDFNQISQAITFDPDSVILLNIGSTNQVIILSTDSVEPAAIDDSETFARPEPAEPPDEEPQTTVGRRSKRQRKMPNSSCPKPWLPATNCFSANCRSRARDLGETLLSEVRNLFPGELRYEPRSAKFDETPEIFWTIKILPQEKALRITVRGTPDDFDQASGIDLQTGQIRLLGISCHTPQPDSRGHCPSQTGPSEHGLGHARKYSPRRPRQGSRCVNGRPWRSLLRQTA